MNKDIVVTLVNLSIMKVVARQTMRMEAIGTESDDVESNRRYVDQLFSSDQSKCLEAVIQLKNSVIGSNKHKSQIIKIGVVPRLMQILIDTGSSYELLFETAVTLGSLAKGTEEHVQGLVNLGMVNVLINGLGHPYQKYVEACLRCLRTIFLCPKVAPVEVIHSDQNIIPHLINISRQSVSNQECVANILTACCQNVDYQDTLCNSGAVEATAEFISSPVQMPSLKCLACLCYHNEKVSKIVASTTFGGKCIPDILMSLLSREKTTEMQLAAAKCLTFIYRAGALKANDPRIVFKTLQTVIRMCKSDKEISVRISGAETLAYLTEVDTELQQIAAISDHLLSTLAEYLRYQPPSSYHNSSGYNGSLSMAHLQKLEQEIKIGQELKQAAFKAFASIGANDEEIRKRLIEHEKLMDYIVSGLSDNNIKVRLEAVRCLHSLSRSVQQLRTSFQDHSVWKPLMKLLNNAPDDILIVASSTLCNLLLEFSPSKEPILESGAVDLLCELTKQEDPALRLNGIWALMNMAFQAEQKTKTSILNTLETDQIFRLLSDPDIDVVMKTLGLLRNLLSTKTHIDHIMSIHGKQIMHAVIFILEGNHAPNVKEQALCILANIADGESAKDFIMSNEDVLKKLMNYMIHANVKLQIASTYCISNLIWNQEEGSSERQAKLRDLGIQKLLKQLLITSDTTLFEKVKTALQQFTS
ncbi:Armadillo repeat-containing protein 8 [Nymphon striatum]|nr:Armadillo repeat-containing protein 8 [Nymphon striatum]